MAKLTMPLCFPLQGTVKRCFDHFYANGKSYNFPPPGMALEVAYFDLRDDLIGSYERENGDVPFLAWLMLLADVEGDSEKLTKFLKAAHNINMNFHKRTDEMDKLTSVYAIKEHEEASADLLGHSILQRARELSALQALVCNATDLNRRSATSRDGASSHDSPPPRM